MNSPTPKNGTNTVLTRTLKSPPPLETGAPRSAHVGQNSTTRNWTTGLSPCFHLLVGSIWLACLHWVRCPGVSSVLSRPKAARWGKLGCTDPPCKKWITCYGKPTCISTKKLKSKDPLPNSSQAKNKDTTSRARLFAGFFERPTMVVSP